MLRNYKVTWTFLDGTSREWSFGGGGFQLGTYEDSFAWACEKVFEEERLRGADQLRPLSIKIEEV